MSASRSFLLVCLLVVNILASSSEEEDAKDLGKFLWNYIDKDSIEFDKCDLLFYCYMHNRCPPNLDDACWEKFSSLLKGTLSS